MGETGMMVWASQRPCRKHLRRNVGMTRWRRWQTNGRSGHVALLVHIDRFHARHGCDRGSFLTGLRRGFSPQGALRNSVVGGKPGSGGQGCSTSIGPSPRRDWAQLLGPSLPSRGADSTPKAVLCHSALPIATCQGPPLSYRPRKVSEG